MCSSNDIIVTYYAGITLQSFVKRRRRELNEITVWEIMRQLGKVQVSMSERGLAHNDIKEDNVCIRYSRFGIEVTAIDFGLANPLGKKVYICPFQPESWRKYPWVAPELLAGGCSSVASDTYSLASLLIYIYEEMSLPLPHQAALWAKEAMGPHPEKRTCINNFLKTCNPLIIDYKMRSDTEIEVPFSGRRKTRIAEELQPLYSPVTCKSSKYRKTNMLTSGWKASSD